MQHKVVTEEIKKERMDSASTDAPTDDELKCMHWSKDLVRPLIRAFFTGKLSIIRFFEGNHKNFH
jgi:hypothetical protein